MLVFLTFIYVRLFAFAHISLLPVRIQPNTKNISFIRNVFLFFDGSAGFPSSMPAGISLSEAELNARIPHIHLRSIIRLRSYLTSACSNPAEYKKHFLYKKCFFIL